MTSFDTVYTAFLSKILDDEWDTWTEEEIEQDLFTLLQAAVVRFKFPRVSLEYTEEGFTDDLTNDEVQILAVYMKCEWLNRTILTWENVKPLYEERDFSQANLLDKFNKMLAAEQIHAKQLEAIYYRSVNKKPFDYTRLAQQSE
jgi:hypothetical protein